MVGCFPARAHQAALTATQRVKPHLLIEEEARGGVWQHQFGAVSLEPCIGSVKASANCMSEGAHSSYSCSSGSCGTVAAGTQQLDEISREHLGLIHCQSVGKATIFIMKEWSKNLITIKPYCYW